VASELARLGVADGDRGAPLQEQVRKRLPHDVALAHHDRVGAPWIDALGVQNRHHPGRRARHETRAAGHEQADVERMESVGVLVGRDRALHRPGRDVLGQGQLDENAVHGGIGIEGRDPAEQFRLGHHVRQFQVHRAHADVGARHHLVADIDFRCRVVTDDDHRQPRLAGARGQPRGAIAKRGANAAGQGNAVDDAGFQGGDFTRQDGGTNFTGMATLPGPWRGVRLVVESGKPFRIKKKDRTRELLALRPPY
jgi:hypothetical protein